MGTDLTVLISTSPIKSNPSTEIIDKCIASVRSYLPFSTIIVMADGVRPEQQDFAENYFKFLTRLKKKYPDLILFRAPAFLHQAVMTKLTLPDVQTPLLMFVEHDFEMYDEIPFDKIIETVRDDERVNLIRLMLDGQLIEGHSHMMLGTEIINGLRLTHTKQWSQRIHVAKTSLYRDLMKFVPDNSRTMLEDLLHGIVASDYDITGEDHFKLWIYTPEGDTMQRFRHLDGREDTPKYEMFNG